jgi:Cu(I)/Ag(I) efflux system protein CusF
MYKSITVTALAAVFALAAIPGYAEVADGTQKVAAQVHQGQGIVNKIDFDAEKINISHEAIKSLKWPKMTMDFKVQDKSALAGLKSGMKVSFELAKFSDGYRITKIVAAKE